MARKRWSDDEIRKALCAAGGNAAKAARQLKCGPSTIYARLRQMSGMQVSSRGGRRNHTGEQRLHPRDECMEEALPAALKEHIRETYGSGLWDPRGLAEAIAAVIAGLHRERIETEKRARLLKSTRKRAWTRERIDAEQARLIGLGRVDEEFANEYPE